MLRSCNTTADYRKICPLLGLDRKCELELALLYEFMISDISSSFGVEPCLKIIQGLDLGLTAALKTAQFFFPLMIFVSAYLLCSYCTFGVLAVSYSYFDRSS